MNDKVHPRYQNLPVTANSSEVMASKYAAEIAKAGNEDDDAELMRFMEEWEDQFKREGLTISNRMIATLSEVTLLCKRSGKEELAGKLAINLVDSYQGIIRQHASISSVMGHLETLANNLFTGIDEIKKLGSDLKKALPRKKLSVSKKVSGHNEGPIVMEHTEEKEPDQGDKEGPQPMQAEPSEHTNQKKKEIKAPDPLETDSMRQLRSSYRDYYMTPEFAAYDVMKQHQIVNYYVEHVLGYSPPASGGKDHSLSMIFDLTDKERVLDVCKRIKAGSLDEAVITESVEEIVEAINVCNAAYGGHKAEEVIVDGRSMLVIK
ncbi:phosphoprotein [Bacopa monnieri virus 2]|uniref:Phosphoprotein n=1 Tax=Bacopa monnieri virus 2 TaxID=2813288 RepID=A0AAD2KQH4_9RHAB|nr:phosphoprotein [Bacopa monnieri virus 2]DAF42450.1 TPA_asm: phosphoprotein [Bacopa monnieri virus 2]